MTKTMDNVTEVIKNFLEEKDYKIKDIDDKGIISVCYQMNIIQICPGSESDNFINMVLPRIDEIDEERPLPSIMNCMHVVTQLMVAKAYPLAQDNVVVSYEFFFKNEEDLLFQIENGFDSLIAAKVKYRKFKEENNG